jgi:hypothetical protein
LRTYTRRLLILKPYPRATETISGVGLVKDKQSQTLVKVDGKQIVKGYFENLIYLIIDFISLITTTVGKRSL